MPTPKQDPAEVKKLEIRLRVLRSFVSRRMKNADWLKAFAIFDKRMNDKSTAMRIYGRWCRRRIPIPGVDDWWIESMENIKDHIESYFKPKA